MAATTIEDIDPDGDRILVVGGDNGDPIVKFRVSTVAMRLASPSFKAMLQGHFLEASAAEVQLPTDNVDGMRLILLLAHLQFERLPEKPGLDLLGHVAKLSDKYNTVKLIKEIMPRWLKAHEPLPKYLEGEFDSTERETDVICHCLWIGWVMRDRELWMAAIASFCEILVLAKVAGLPDLPPDHAAWLLTIVSSNLGELLDKVYDVLEQGPEQGGLACAASNVTTDQTLCYMRQLGSLFGVVIGLGIPYNRRERPRSPDIDFSYQDVAHTLNNLMRGIESDEFHTDQQRCFLELEAIRAKADSFNCDDFPQAELIFLDLLGHFQ